MDLIGHHSNPQAPLEALFECASGDAGARLEAAEDPLIRAPRTRGDAVSASHPMPRRYQPELQIEGCVTQEQENEKTAAPGSRPAHPPRDCVPICGGSDWLRSQDTNQGRICLAPRANPRRGWVSCGPRAEHTEAARPPALERIQHAHS